MVYMVAAMPVGHSMAQHAEGAERMGMAQMGSPDRAAWSPRPTCWVPQR